MNTFAGTLLCCTAALSLAACGGNDRQTAADTDNSSTVLDNPASGPVLTLSPEQQQRRNALNMQSYEAEYRGYVDGQRSTGGSPADQSAGAGTSSEMTSNTTTSNTMQDSSEPANAAGDTAPGANGSPASFASLDRNHDGKLSVAEYAVYAVGLDPTARAGKPNDQQPPYATAEQLNRAADGFFFYDRNGDTYLQPDEYEPARMGGAASR